MSDVKPTIHEVMDAMPEQWRGRWCGGGFCACMGAANCSGGLLRNGFTIEDWKAWKVETGFVEPVREEPDFSKLVEFLKECGVQAISVEDPPEYHIPYAHSEPAIREKRGED